MSTRRRKFIRIISLTAATLLLIVAVAGQSLGRDEDGSRVDLRVENLDNLEEGHYEGWVIDGDDKISFGKFNMTDDGEFETLSGKRISHFQTEREVDDVNEIVITIEPDDDDDPAPSDTVILEDETDSDDEADLEFEALDLDDVSGDYILATPSIDDSRLPAGIWFFDPDDNESSLDIPDAPAGWKWEGWVVYRDMIPLTTGRFSDPDGPDEFEGFSGPNPVPPFPGQDFIENLPLGLKGPLEIDDGDSIAAITLEPDNNGTDPTGPLPFQLKPLVDRIPEDVDIDRDFDYNLNLSLKNIPSGRARLR